MTLEALWYGEWPTPGERLARGALAPLSLAWRLAAGLGALSWQTPLRRPGRVEGLRVVSVGNLVVGGAGKTPVVIFLARWASAAGHRVAVLTRGYGRSTSRVIDFSAAALASVELAGDEPRLIARRAPAARVLVGADRLATARQARAGGATFAILDDGFQHRRLHRDVDLVVLGGEGNGWVLPAGPLREPRSALARADLLWCRDGAPTGPRPVVVARHAATALVDAQGLLTPLGELEGAPVVALAGIARPSRFEASLVAAGARVVDRHWYADHHRFTPAELERVVGAAARAGARIVTTEKDLERLPPAFPGVALRLGVEVASGLEPLAALLELPQALVPPLAG